ncbi:MAG: CDP-6-deoxy-delta-3,4-glucoseen reductase [gamma proteobacterium symbiont of Bathyaustriella thionipta]|nr:CDP-6-deoxy-delta-3,4-glucoseen reductase [gamma proteobacterium symbiont of Bathyaustriella thionipta]
MSYKVQIQPSGHELQVAANETILDAAVRAGIGLPYGCRNGRCGSCISKLLSGEVSYPSGKTQALEEADADALLTCQAHPQSDLVIQVNEVENSAEIEVRTLPCRVNAIEHLADDVVRLYLKLPDNQRLQFMPGQYLDFLLSDGRRRAFSIANAPHDDEQIELHIRHVDGGAFTDYVFEQMKEKAIQRIQAPLGSFVPREDSERPMIFVGGGTGFAPLKGMIEHAFYTGVKRPMHLFWGVRARPDLYLADLPESWQQQHEHFQFTPVLSEPADADHWSGQTGWVHESVVAQYPDLSAYDLYMAGPPPMIIAARDTFRQHGLPDEQMFYDSFEYGAENDKA